MDFIKKYKLQLGGLLLFIILMIFTFVTVVNLLYPDINKSLYGNRLEEIEKYPISNKRITDIKTALTATGKTNKVTYDLQGKIINVVIDVKKDTDMITAKTLGDKLLESFSTKEKDFYDIQLFIICSEQANVLYPIIGYKHHTSLIFRWTNNS